jgi:gluconate 2-dehydrogenase gamma chain
MAILTGGTMANANSTGNDRRGFLKQVAALAGSAPVGSQVFGPAGAAFVASAPASVANAADPPPAAAPFTGYQFLGPKEAAFVEALVNVMCPADQYTPSGVDCGLANYIDRQLASAFGQGEGRYLRGPWKQGKPQLGYQLPLTPAEFFKVGLNAASDACTKKYDKSFDQLPSSDANAFLQDLQAAKYADPRGPLALWFNELVYPLFQQACFADPMYGGNNNKVFWKLVGYPGLPATHALDMVQYRGKPYPGAKDPKSIVDFS